MLRSRPFGRRPADVLVHSGQAMEPLEPRTLLSLSPINPSPEPLEAATITWMGAQVEVVRNAYLMTFQRPMESGAAEQRTREALIELGIDPAGIRRIGLGQSVRFTTDQRIGSDAALAIRERFRDVKAIEPDLIYKTQRIPNDPLFGNVWQLSNPGTPLFGLPATTSADISATSAWDTTIGSRDVIIAVIDTGVDLQHADLIGNIYRNPGEIPGNGIDDDGNGFIDDVNGWDFGELDNNPDDVEGHGTAVAGTIAAQGDNGIGMVGVAWNLSILPIKIADRFGQLSTSAIVGAHDYLTMMRGRGVNIVASNNSYGAFIPAFYEDQLDGFTGERSAIQRFINSGGTFVAAAGNDGNDNDSTFTSFPASYNIPGIIAVAATTPSDTLAGFSNFGQRTVDLGAPGLLTYTTLNGGGYGYISGTSFSSPITAGVVGLLKSVRPQLSAVEIRRILIDSADPLPALQGRSVSGGRLNAAEALRIAGIDGPVVTRIDPGPVTLPVNVIDVTFSKPINAAALTTAAVSLVRAGGDNNFENGTQPVTVASIAATSSTTVRITLGGLTSIVDSYRLTLSPSGFRDSDGNQLNGNVVAGTPETYVFRVASVGGTNEPNDSLSQATPVNFVASGTATFDSARIGDGLNTVTDVDLYRVTLPRGGLITARIDAFNLPTASSFDSYIRLFAADGQQLAANDQFNGPDALIDFFVASGGTYYVGVSGFGNENYDPRVPGSGRAQSEGVYNLTIKAELVEDDRRTFPSALNSPQVPPLLIPDSQSVTNSVFVQDGRQVVDVNVRLDVEHQFLSDLRVSLISPRGTSVLLVDRRGGSGENFTGTLLDDEASVPVALGAAPFGGEGGYRPDTPLSTFDGQPALGSWTLRVEDTRALNAGRLLGWTLELVLENDIFGPFELNDTITTARPINPGLAGVTSIDAAIGDGGYGFLDVDFYSFIADAGTTLTASVLSGVGTGLSPGVPVVGQLNTAIRLFDPQGRELALNSPALTNNSAITTTLTVGGTYFISVSEASNTAFNTAQVASGVPAVTTGAYRLNVSTTAGVSDGSVIMSAGRVGLGIDSSGSLIASGGGTPRGLTFDGVEFLETLNAGSAFFGAAASGFSFKNAGATAEQLPFKVINESDFSNRRAVATGSFRGMQIERSFSYGQNDAFVAIDVLLTNATGQILTDVSWMEAFNPSQGETLSPRSDLTINDVNDSAPLASARYINNTFQQGLTVAIAAPASDTRAKAAVVSPLLNIRDPQQILALSANDPNGTLSDDALALAFNIGSIQPQETVRMRYFILLGSTPAEVNARYATINSGLGAGHLTADPRNPATEDLDTGPASIAATAPLLPYRLYYPEGYANSRASTFIPIINPNDRPSRVFVIARYEDASKGPRDAVLFDSIVQPRTRAPDGVTITTPALYASNTLLVRKDEPYAIEIRSELPMAATFSHFDFDASTGEAFTSTTSRTWSFGDGGKDQGSSDFVTFYNPTPDPIKVTTRLFYEGGGTPVELTLTLQGFRRGGWNFQAESAVRSGKFGVLVDADGPIVAALTRFDTVADQGLGILGTPGIGSLTGATPEGIIGLSTQPQVLNILNANALPAEITFSFLFASGSSRRVAISVPAQSRAQLDIASIRDFPSNVPFGIIYESTQPVSMSQPTYAIQEGEGLTLAERSASLWAFSEGFRPANAGPGGNTNVTERLRLLNPQITPTLVEITLNYTDGGSTTFRRTVPARAVLEVDVHTLVDASRAGVDSFYGLSVKGAAPIVASINRADLFFKGSFATMGTPLGIRAALA